MCQPNCDLTVWEILEKKPLTMEAIPTSNYLTTFVVEGAGCFPITTPTYQVIKRTLFSFYIGTQHQQCRVARFNNI